MGILDDAIREHLELKRRLGADDEELARLEGEAFGPASRPGDPDFPAQGQAEAATAIETAIGERPPAGDAEPSTGEAAEAAAAPEPLPPSEPPPREPEAPSTPEPEAPSTPEPEAPAPLFHDQQAAEPEPEPERAEPEPERAEPAVEAPLTDERPAVEPSQTEESALEPSDTGERPIESFDTVEHPFEQEIEDTGEAEVVEGELEQEEEVEDDEDVLEETPEFLRDAPEDDELWFEQGEPKDFDF